MTLYSKPRFYFIDVVKVIALFAMSIIHTSSVLNGYVNTGLVTYNVDINCMDLICGILYLFVPGVYMLCMGFTLSNSSCNTPIKLAKRGLKLLLIGLILNVLRGSIIFTIGGFLYQDNSMFVEAIIWLLGSDILYFAGLYLLIYSLLIKLRMNDITVLVIAIALSIIGSFLPPVSIDNYYLDTLIGNFVYTNNLSYFPFVWWMIYPFIGYLFCKGFNNTNNKSTYMIKCIVGSIVVLVVTGLVIMILKGNVLDYLLWGGHSLTMSTFSMLLTISLEILYMCIIYFVFEGAKPNVIRECISFISSRLNMIYCVHWILLMNVIGISSIFIDYNFTNVWQVIVIGVVVMIVSITVGVSNHKHKK